jgi:hypothetical protein
VTAAGAQGAEWVNSTDRRQWIHDGTLWRERPFQDRLIGHGIGWKDPGGTIPNGATWQDQVHTRVAFWKVRDDTALRFSGYFGCYVSAGTGRVYTSVWVNQTQAGGNPPPDKEIAGHAFFNDVHHKTLGVNITLSGADAPNAGNHSADIMVMSPDSPTLKYDLNDWWALTVWEVGL